MTETNPQINLAEIPGWTFVPPPNTMTEIRLGNVVVTEKLIAACHDINEFVEFLRRNDPHFAELWTAFQVFKRLDNT